MTPHVRMLQSSLTVSLTMMSAWLETTISPRIMLTVQVHPAQQTGRTVALM